MPLSKNNLFKKQDLFSEPAEFDYYTLILSMHWCDWKWHLEVADLDTPDPSAIKKNRVHLKRK